MERRNFKSWNYITRNILKLILSHAKCRLLHTSCKKKPKNQKNKQNKSKPKKPPNKKPQTFHDYTPINSTRWLRLFFFICSLSVFVFCMPLVGASIFILAQGLMSKILKHFYCLSSTSLVFGFFLLSFWGFLLGWLGFLFCSGFWGFVFVFKLC